MTLPGRFSEVRQWLPEGRRGAVCFSIDDVHPSTRHDAYEAGGDLSEGTLGHLEYLLTRHHRLRATLFVTSDWRSLSPFSTRPWLAALPVVRDWFYLSPILPMGTMRLSHHPRFVHYLRSLPRVECAYHGLDHVSRGSRMPEEFGRLTFSECRRRLVECEAIFHEAGLGAAPGLCPPGWVASPSLIAAMSESSLQFLSSARDIISPIEIDGRTRMSGLRGMSLVHPQPIANGRLLHFTVNFQATSDIDRAKRIVDAGGLLHVKAHAVKEAFGYIAKDGLDQAYRDVLDALFSELDREYGEALWWASMGEITREWPREA